MTPKMYLELANLTDAGTLATIIDTLSNQERIELRQQLEAIQCKKLVRNLYYNYDTQEWI